MARIKAPRTRAINASKSGGSSFKDLLAPRLFGFKLPWYWTLISLAIFPFLIDMQVRTEIKATAYSMLEPLTYSGQTSLRNAGYGFDGVLHVYDISYEPEDGSAPIRIGQVDVETPGFWWVVRQVMPESKPSRSERLLDLVSASGDDEDWYYPATARLVLHFRDLDWGDYGIGGMLPAVDWVGSYTGALFEAEGCTKDNWWTADDLRGRMGLDPGDGDVRVAYEVTGEHSLRRTVAFGNAQLSELTIRSDYELPGPAEHFLDLMSDDWRTTAIEWTVQDHGFVAKRNQFCADAAKIDVATQMERHLQSVQRVLATHGIKASPEVMASYARYARDGQKLVWRTHLGSGRAVEDYAELSLAAAFGSLAPTLTVGDSEVAYDISAINERPFPDAMVGSTWEIIEYESGLRAPPASVAAAAMPTATPAANSALATRAEPEQLKFDDLDDLIGGRVEVIIEGNRRLRGIVESANAKQVELKISMGGGYARMAILRHRVQSARRI